MPEEKTIEELTAAALERSSRVIEIWTTFLQEASVLVFVFGILDMYAGGKLTVRVATVVAVLGLSLLGAAFSVKSVFYRLLRRGVVHLLTLQEASVGREK